MRTQFESFTGTNVAAPLVRVLIKKGLVREEHVRMAKSPVDALGAILSEIVANNFSGAKDEFDINICVSDRIEDVRGTEGVLFFTWNNVTDPQYIPLRPVFEALEGNPNRSRLMGSLYQWLYVAASRVFEAFGFDEAKNMYAWRKECYTEARESGEDVDFEGEVEASDPDKVMDYIRDSRELVLENDQAAAAISSIADVKLRSAVVNAQRLYLASRKIKFPVMSKDCQKILRDAAYYMDGYPIPGLGISHWRDDPIVSWFDEFCRDQFESGSNCRAPIILCFRPNDTKFFSKMIDALPALVQMAAGLSEWVRFAQELENACNYGDR
jgi:hypothetical protein